MISFKQLSIFSENIAVFTVDGTQYKYRELLDFSKIISNNIKNRSLVFCLAYNSIGSLAGYLAFVLNKIVPVMLDSNLDSELLEKLIRIYKPDYLWVPKKTTI